MIVFSTSRLTTTVLGLLSVVTMFEGSYPLLLNYSRSTSVTTLRSFDFASKAEWDRFYQKTTETENENIAPAETTEWHSSIPLDDIALTVPPNGRCLVIGCGNSLLPDRILLRKDAPRSLVLLDSSPVCLDQLRNRYQGMTGVVGDNDHTRRSSSTDLAARACCTDIDYVCGDATQLSQYFSPFVGSNDSDENYNGDSVVNQDRIGHKDPTDQSTSFDIIIDKGLTDAILCGEGWDGPLEKLLHESAKVLSTKTGKYLLISYKLPSSTKQFLVTVGKTVGLEWEFDFELPSAAVSRETPDRKAYQRVSVAMARRNDKMI